MKHLLTKVLAAAAAFAVVACSCSKSPLANGGVSETTNGVSASIVYPGGKACANSRVRLRQSDYLAPVPGVTGAGNAVKIDSITDSQGRFHLAGITLGQYIIEVMDTLGNAIALTAVVVTVDSLVNLGTDTIRRAGAVEGTVANAPQGALYVRVRGLEHAAVANAESGDFLCAGLPAGTFDLRIVSSVPGNLSTDVPQVLVKPDDTTALGAVSLWQHSRRMVLNTAQGGASVGETVTDFPVLVRLTSAALDFSQVKGNGVDLGFFRTGNKPLPYEIEQWDSAGQNALVWVRVDTIFGSNDTQSVLMVWGNTGALPQSNGMVFDTAQGFQGVWHFDEQGNAPCLDATKNSYTGTPYGMTAQNSVPAVIGSGLKFDGLTSWMQMHGTADGKLNLPEAGNYTLSAWVLLDTADTGSQVILSKGYWQYSLKAVRDSAAGGYAWQFTEYQANSGWQETRVVPAAPSWTFLAAQHQGNRQYLYVNGVPADSGIVTVPGTAPRDTGNDLTVGRYIQSITTGDMEGFGYFRGTMDEVRICNVARSPAWIRLCYMNQKASDALVQFK